MFSIPPVIGISPFEQPDVALVIALSRAGALGVLDLGRDRANAERALSELSRRARTGFGVRIPDGVDASSWTLPPKAVVVVAGSPEQVTAWPERLFVAQVTSLEEGRDAALRGAHALILKGNEAGGRVGEETSFILLQHVLQELNLPVWVQGGIGLHSGAAAIAGGAAGVVIDSQLALLEEATTGAPLRRLLAVLDGSETQVVSGHRLLSRPGIRQASPDMAAASIAALLGADPETDLIATGQDVAFAKPFADKFASVSRLVRALEAASVGHLRQARALRPLAKHSPLARSLGTLYPILQGPMTRVSDTADFAEHVAQGGGLPFLALSLLRGERLRTLLAETKAQLGSRSWGVGILGFAPPDLRDEQLAAIAESKPPFAIIAGGRPAQAAALENSGIPTFLHVPSKGLLELFLKEGARRFIFEGRECGGHVGPRSSFVLWESVVETLLAHDSLLGVQVVFAGGIHDARSARMVSTLAAPLAAAGAEVGVLLGTAYLFTEEAVRGGAIGPVFQEEAILCEHTRLVETAPGHATRCADGEFVRIFEREKARLSSGATDQHVVWEALEQLNLGRLRIASKGVRREGDALVALDPEEQRRDGMFMIGQVSALRREIVTIEKLHRTVCDESVSELESLAANKKELSRSTEHDVAIVGMACIYPDAPDVGTFWNNVLTGHNAIREVSKDRWDAALYYDPKGTGEKTPSKWGGFIPPTIFDPSAFGIPPRSLAAIDPTQILALLVSKQALDDAGYRDRPFDRERASVIFGAEGGSDLSSAYGFRAAFPQFAGALPAQLEEALPKLTEDSFPGILGNVIAGRIANRLDLRGVNFTVDAACASSLAAVDGACKELRAGTSDLVIAGGADLHNAIYDYLMFASVHALSPSGQCRPFDSKADGIALGEGVAAVVLRRLDDAERDGNRIYAVIRGIAGSSDGKSLGLTAPRKEGQLRSLERAYDQANTSPSDVGLVEAHGTGTVVGDRTELATLTELFSSYGALAHSCTLGSVKAQIGHTKCAAGLAGLIKSALAIHHGVLPANKNVTSPNPGYDASRSPFVLRDTAAPWLSKTRVAGVSAFGFGGTNFHAVLASHEPSLSLEGPDTWPTELFLLHGASAYEAKEFAQVVLDVATSPLPPKLRALAARAAEENRASPVQAALVASSHAELRDALFAFINGQPHKALSLRNPVEGSVAFLFPGQGSQRPNMVADLLIAFPGVRDVADMGRAWSDVLFPGAAFSPNERAAQLRAITDTRVAQPTLGIAGMVISRLLRAAGVVPAMSGGHSYGELVALADAGTFDEETLLALSEARGSAILEAAGDAPGSMAAVKASYSIVSSALGPNSSVVIANNNAPDQVVIAGAEADLKIACDKLLALGISARPIPVACAFHSPIVARAAESFAKRLDEVHVRSPRGVVYANTTASPYAMDPADVRRTLAAQIAMPVRFLDQVEAMYAAGARIFVEAGPGGILSDLTRRVLLERPHMTVTCDRADTHGVTALQLALAKLATAGVHVDVTPLFRGRTTAADISDATLFAAPKTAWSISGGSARPLFGELPDFAMKRLSSPVALAVAPELSADGTREDVMRDYLKTVRDLVEGQRQVMLRFLGAAPAPTEWAVPPSSSTMTLSLPPPTLQELPVIAPKEERPLDVLIRTVSERTGYPPDLLGPDLDLEADLGIDSIKRIEILGALKERLGLSESSGASQADMESLSRVKTLRGIADVLEAGRNKSGQGDGAVTIVEAKAREVSPATVGRYAIDVVPTEAASPPKELPIAGELAGRMFAVTRDNFGIAEALQARLVSVGANAAIIAGPTASLPDGVDGLIDLATAESISHEALTVLFSRIKGLPHGEKPLFIFSASGMGGRFGHAVSGAGTEPRGAGVSGLMKSVAKEFPNANVRAVDLDLTEPPIALADHVFEELLLSSSLVEVGYKGAERISLSATLRGRTPAEKPLELGERSVVLITGGARGITAQIAVAFAQRYRCHLELVGRSPVPDDEDVEQKSAQDASALRRILVARRNGAGPISPAAIESEVRAILAGREIRETLEAIRKAGGHASYHSASVRDREQFGALILAIEKKHGRVDGVIHGAGVAEDKLLLDKQKESFERVVGTKLVGAETLLEKLHGKAKFIVFFSSVSGAFGNRGQSDYAAANDALDKIARFQNRGGTRVLSINWGPWRGAGMVRPELEREYQRRGIALIPPAAGIDCFFEELVLGADAQVVLSSAPPASLE